ncbi:VacJ family lipoprotein [Sulfurimonas aquatica]|uniref:VacJ family lipoprotein n=2 Tax=Sulfurimonas aquatica TaxID=2672570 RepID=A0A975B2L9_9BACT|nr:VacJ family lipoprotein [Sulfurimonas aquatica]
MFNQQEEPLSSDEIESNLEDEELFEEFADETDIEEIYDPFMRYNEVMTTFNDVVFENFFNPLAKGYKYVIHQEIRESVNNFFHNILFLPRFANNILQAKFKNATEETGRFVINSTIGVLGLFDVAKSQFNLEKHEEDFGQTLGFYGVGSGPHIVLPILGPSNLRDMLSLFPDALLSPINYDKSVCYTITDTWPEYIAVSAYNEINSLSLNLGEYEKLKKDAITLYPFLRDVYEQHRVKQIEE